MTKLYNQVGERQKRKILRNGSTESERLLWFYLRNEKLGWRFRRQHSVGHYILDFYCPQAKLAIELDGAVHDSDTAQENDREREKFLAACGIRVLRFRNKEAIENIIEVLNQIKNSLPTPSLPPPY